MFTYRLNHPPVGVIFAVVLMLALAGVVNRVHVDPITVDPGCAAFVLALFGALAGGASAVFWLMASKVKPVYNTAMLGINVDEKRRTDRQATLNAYAALSAAVAIGCQAAISALDAAGFID